MMRRARAFGLVLLALTAAPAYADIYGYIDEDGRGHFADSPLDNRYKLFMKTATASIPLTLAETEGATGASVVAAASTTTPEAAALVRPIPLQTRKRYSDMIAKVAKEQKVEPALLHAVVAVESAYNPRAKSPKGATGLMQLMPATAKRYGVTNLLDPFQNLRAGARYLRDLMAMFNNNMNLAIAAYNAGEGAVIRSGHAIPNYPETRAYVPRVMQHYEHYRDLAS
jgi:soluble lytic murein transglycosylase-like protein